MRWTTNDSGRFALNPPRAARALALILIGSALGIGAYQFLDKSPGPARAQREPTSPHEHPQPHEPAHAHEPAHQHVPYLVRNGERITIPENSPLRGKLTIAEVGEKEIQHKLVLPAVVEADPARLAKILPPLAGRIAFPNPDMRLKPNMFANVTFFAPARVMPIVPTTALILKNEGDRAFVEVAPWTFEARPVAIDFQEGEQAIVASGLMA